jgi:hypothetical protein
MKKLVYGTVSALALMLAATGAQADDVQAALGVSATSTTVTGNAGLFTATIGDNEIDQNAFGQAKGAFNVGQNSSINSAVQQSMAIAAIINSPDSSDTVVGNGETNQLGLAVSLGSSHVSGNAATIDLVTGHNEIENNAFGQSAGAFNVLQNHSLNSGVSQSMAIGAVINNDKDHDSTPFDSSVSVAVSALSGTVSGNLAAVAASGTLFSNTNSITNNAFGQARGAYNVLQNNSINSSVQQGLAIGAVVNRAN